jgi:hypothetical protein
MEPHYPQTPHGRLVVTYLDELDRRGIRYALLRNHAGLPDRPQGDIDVVTDDVRAAGTVLHEAAERSGYVPVRVARHTWHVIHALAPGAGIAGGEPVVIDLQPGVTHRRGISIAAGRVLAGRRQRDGLWIAGPGVEGAALVLHCAIERNAAPARYTDRLAQIVPEHRAEVVEELGAVVGEPLAERATDDVEGAIPQIRAAFRGQPGRALAQRTRALARYARRPLRLHVAPGVADELDRRSVRIARSRLDALRRSAVLVSEDGEMPLPEALEACRRAYAG